MLTTVKMCATAQQIKQKISLTLNACSLEGDGCAARLRRTPRLADSRRELLVLLDKATPPCTVRGPYWQKPSRILTALKGEAVIRYGIEVILLVHAAFNGCHQ